MACMMAHFFGRFSICSMNTMTPPESLITWNLVDTIVDLAGDWVAVFTENLGLNGHSPSRGKIWDSEGDGFSIGREAGFFDRPLALIVVFGSIAFGAL